MGTLFVRLYKYTGKHKNNVFRNPVEHLIEGINYELLDSFRNGLKQINIPVLILFSEKDRIVPKAILISLTSLSVHQNY